VSEFGAVVLLSTAPVPIVKGFEPTYSTEADVSATVEEWL
jgi:DNA polymerase sigma